MPKGKKGNRRRSAGARWSRRLLPALLLWGCAPSGSLRTPAADFDVRHYAVTLSPDFDGHDVTGESLIRLRSERDGLREVAFSDNALAIDAASVEGQPAAIERRGGSLVVLLPRPLARSAEAEIRVAFHGVPARGLHFAARSVHTGYFACDWMICVLDRPGDKASFELRLEIPEGMTSVGNGSLRIEPSQRAGHAVHVWSDERAHSAYLFGFAAGRFGSFVERRGDVELAAVSAVANAERLKELFAPTGEMLAFFEVRAGVPFPHRRYTQILVEGDAAQEAAHFSVIGAKLLAPILETPEEDWSIAHELAHQWWGNLVTCASWDHFWLNEGVTVFMVAAWKEHAWGRTAYEREMALARERLQRAIDAGFDRALADPRPYPSLRIRRAIQYSKGALFMDALRRELGEESFWKGLRGYTRSHAGGAVTSSDLQRAFESAGGRSLSALFDRWVHGVRRDES